MADAKVLKETPISIKELKDELALIKKRDNELNFRANKTEDYLNKFTGTEKAEELEAALNKLKIPRIKDQHIKKIIDIMPQTVDELKSLIQGYPISISADNLKKISETIKKFTTE